MSIEAAPQLLRDWVPNEKLQLHMKKVTALMKSRAEEMEGADPLQAQA